MLKHAPLLPLLPSWSVGWWPQANTVYDPGTIVDEPSACAVFQLSSSMEICTVAAAPLATSTRANPIKLCLAVTRPGTTAPCIYICTISAPSTAPVFSMRTSNVTLCGGGGGAELLSVLADLTPRSLPSKTSSWGGCRWCSNPCDAVNLAYLNVVYDSPKPNACET